MHNDQKVPNNEPSINNFDAISLGVASPEEILSWSHGEVKKPETINYRTQKPERDGLFCERIFGPTKNWECYCGKYKRIRYKGVICEKCGVEVTRSSVRRDRMGHIKLAVPVTHIWFLRSTPSRIGLLLDLPIKTIEHVVYFAAYIVIAVDEEAKAEAKEQLLTEFKNYKKKIQDETKEKAKAAEDKKEREQIEADGARRIEELTEQHTTARDELESLATGKVLSELLYRDMSMKFGHVFQASTGAESIRQIIENIDLDKLIDQLNEDLKKSSGQKQKKLIKRIKLCGSLLKANIKPEWMVMSVLPVIPPDLRPMVQLDGGRFAASDLNDLYRRVINRNNRLKKLMTIGAPEVICRNEKRMLQEAVDTLLNNSARSGKIVLNTGDKRKLRSLSDMLKGKQGRFRQNLLGKRVDYSGRSVIVIGPRLKLNQCGLPKIMALELFRPFVIGRLIRDGYAHNIKNAEKLISANRKEVWDILEDVTKEHYVLLNRAPTLHRLGIQAFQPVLVEGKAIQIHPLVCAAFNADFDGDQMAVHVPLSQPAQREAKNLISSARNLLKPSAGEPTVTPTQDMILGCYYLTNVTPGAKGEGMIFADANEAITAYRLGHAHLQAPIKARITVGEGENTTTEIVETTIGRLIFNTFLPEKLRYLNQTMNKKALNNLVAQSYELCGEETTAKLADEIKRIGFKFATKSGLTIGAQDMIIPDDKERIINDASEVIKKINDQYWKGLVTDYERYMHTIQVWSDAKSLITDAMQSAITPNNDIHYMVNSGARGNWGQVTQLCGMKGLVANPAGKTIELPIKSNLKEGFTILEYFIATHGGRKGKSDTALKTAEAGYLTRRLVDAVQDIIVKENDCGAPESITIKKSELANIRSDEFESKIFGRTLAAPVADPKSGEVLIDTETQIDKAKLEVITKAKVEEVKLRSIVTCQSENGVCQLCYGIDLCTNRPVEIGTAVGIIAAQSIGEPGTQLTMRTFHMGGVAEGQDITQGLTRVEEVFEARNQKAPATLSEISGTVKVNRRATPIEISVESDGPVAMEYTITATDKATVKVGDKVTAKQLIAKSTLYKNTVKADEDGKVVDITETSIVIESLGVVTKLYSVPQGKVVKVNSGDRIEKGDALTSGHLNLRELFRLTNMSRVQQYIVDQVQEIYESQGQNINDKHVEIIARQMLSKARVIDPGDSSALPGEILNVISIDIENKALIKAKKRPIQYERLLLGLTRIALFTDSWLSAASFQETIRVLVEASTTRRIDQLQGLKENVIIGKLIPAGETYRRIHKEELAKAA